MRELAKQNDALLEGLESRLKSRDSLAKKLARDSLEQQISLEQAVPQIPDIVRYTMVFEDGRYSRGVVDALAQLEAAGYKSSGLKIPGVLVLLYKGINAVFDSPDGQKFELQFHTEKLSYEAGHQPPAL